MAGPPFPVSGRQRSFSADPRSAQSLNNVPNSPFERQSFDTVFSHDNSLQLPSRKPLLSTSSDVEEDAWGVCDEFSVSEPPYISFQSQACSRGKDIPLSASLSDGQDASAFPLSPPLPPRPVSRAASKRDVERSRGRVSDGFFDTSGGSTTPTGAKSSDFSRTSSPACEINKVEQQTYAFDAYPSQVFSQWEGKDRTGESCGLVPTTSGQQAVSSSSAFPPAERNSAGSLGPVSSTGHCAPVTSQSSSIQRSVGVGGECRRSPTEAQRPQKPSESYAGHEDTGTRASAGRERGEDFNQYDSAGKGPSPLAGGDAQQQPYANSFFPIVGPETVQPRARRAVIEYEAKDLDSVLVIKHETGSLRVTPCTSFSPVCFGWPSRGGRAQGPDVSGTEGGTRESSKTPTFHLAEQGAAKDGAVNGTPWQRPAGRPSNVADHVVPNHPEVVPHERLAECHPPRSTRELDISPADGSRTDLFGTASASPCRDTVPSQPVPSSVENDDNTNAQHLACAREFGADVNNTKLFQKLLRSGHSSAGAKEAFQTQRSGWSGKSGGAAAAKSGPVSSRFRSPGRAGASSNCAAGVSSLPGGRLVAAARGDTRKSRPKNQLNVMGQQDRVFLRDVEARRRQMRLRDDSAAGDLGMASKSTRRPLSTTSKYGTSQACSLNASSPHGGGGGTGPSAGVPRDFVGSASNVQLPKWMRDYGVQDPCLGTGGTSRFRSDDRAVGCGYLFGGDDKRGRSAAATGHQQEDLCNTGPYCGDSSLDHGQHLPQNESGLGVPFLPSGGECPGTRHLSPGCWAGGRGGNYLLSGSLVASRVPPRAREGVHVTADFPPVGTSAFPEGCSAVSFPVTHFVCSNCGASADPPYCPTCGAMIVQLEPPIVEVAAAGRLVSHSCTTDKGPSGALGVRGRGMVRGSPRLSHSRFGREKKGEEDNDLRGVSYAPYDVSLSARSSRNPSALSRGPARDVSRGSGVVANGRKGKEEKMNNVGGGVLRKNQKGEKGTEGTVPAKQLGKDVWSSPRICALLCSFLKLPQLLSVRRCSKNLLVAAQFEMRFVLYATLQRLLLEEEKAGGKASSPSARAKSCSPAHGVSPRDRTPVGGDKASKKKNHFTSGASRRQQSLPACPFSAATLRRLLQLSADEVKKLKEGKLPDRRAADARSPRLEDIRNRAIQLRRRQHQEHVMHNTRTGRKTAGSKQERDTDTDDGRGDGGEEGLTLEKKKHGKGEKAWTHGSGSSQRETEDSDFGLLGRASEAHIRREIQFQREQELLLKERQLQEQERHLLQKEQMLLLQQNQQRLQEKAFLEQARRSAAGGRSMNATFGYGVVRGRQLGRSGDESGGAVCALRGAVTMEEDVSQPAFDFNAEPPTFRRLRHSFLKLWNYNEKQLKSALYRYAFSSFPTYCFDTAAILCRCIYQLCANATAPLPLNSILLLLSDRQSYLWRRMGRLSGYLICSLAPPCASSLPGISRSSARSRVSAPGTVQRLLPLRLSETASFLCQSHPMKTREHHSRTRLSFEEERHDPGFACSEEPGYVGDTSIRASVLESIELKLAKLSPEFIDEFVLYGRQQAVLMQLQDPESGGGDRSLLASSLRKLRKQPQDRYVLMDLYEWLAAALTFVQKQARLRSTSRGLKTSTPAAATRGRTPVRRIEGGGSVSSGRPFPVARSASRKDDDFEGDCCDEGRGRRGNATPGFGDRSFKNTPGVRRTNATRGRSTSRAGGQPGPSRGEAESRPLSQVVHGYGSLSRGRVHQDAMCMRKTSPVGLKQGADGSSAARSRSVRGTRTAEVQRAVLGGAAGRSTRFGAQGGQELSNWTPTRKPVRPGLSPARSNGLTAKEAAALCKLLQSQGQILEEVKQILRQISKP
ncbi:hypothetical protein CSUI_007275 [Cystoisospora suis]|uniref:Uncharacterized protein n=1 Tax=Cystoisospora suis TaxID=483139 RepID=A0A2C6KP51_9APIC|nr:hypothetical protein CSUI_007275 [Cystoisospora suis]